MRAKVPKHPLPTPLYFLNGKLWPHAACGASRWSKVRNEPIARPACPLASYRLQIAVKDWKNFIPQDGLSLSQGQARMFDDPRSPAEAAVCDLCIQEEFREDFPKQYSRIVDHQSTSPKHAQLPHMRTLGSGYTSDGAGNF